MRKISCPSSENCKHLTAGATETADKLNAVKIGNSAMSERLYAQVGGRRCSQYYESEQSCEMVSAVFARRPAYELETGTLTEQKIAGFCLRKPKVFSQDVCGRTALTIQGERQLPSRQVGGQEQEALSRPVADFFGVPFLVGD